MPKLSLDVLCGWRSYCTCCTQTQWGQSWDRGSAWSACPEAASVWKFSHTGCRQMASPLCVCACALSCAAPGHDQKKKNDLLINTVWIWWIHTSHIPLLTNLSAAIVTLITLETLLVFVGLLVLNESIALMKDSITVAAFLSHLNKRMLLSQVNTWKRQKQTQVSRSEWFLFSADSHSDPLLIKKKDRMQLTKVTFAGDDSITMWTVKLGNILCMFLQNMHLHGATLSKAGMADIALVWLLTCNKKDETQWSRS